MNLLGHHSMTPFGYSRTVFALFILTYGINAGSLPSEIQDNHKPVFTNCSKYQPSVKEEEPPGTFVIRVTATDRDPSEHGGKITYEFVRSNTLKFDIDSETGDIRTRHYLDRDEPSREKVVYLTVRATDNGSPQLFDMCTIKVVIEDVNDNAPVFDKVDYSESVPQDLVPGNEVMRISATDIDDGANSLVYYDLEARRPEDAKYFHIDKATGVIILDKPIDREPGYRFRMQATAKDQGEDPHKFQIDLEIFVVESHKKAPTFKSIPASPIRLKENLSDFSYNIATLIATANTDEAAPVFELVTGRTEQTNRLNTFRLESEGEKAYIRLARKMDYESIPEYTLTIRVQNKYSLAAETAITIQVEDVNDNIPMFNQGESGIVLENEPPGTPVMQVKAIDSDISPQHNQVTYELADSKEYFTIDPYTGNITTLVTFDREEQDVYFVTVYATDNSPSALFAYPRNEPNQGQQGFKILIAGKKIITRCWHIQNHYMEIAISENANINALVVEVTAVNNHTAFPVTYSIMNGNVGDVFVIEPQTGKIRVHKPLDYEKINNYTLKVRAFDGAYEDYALVDIKIENVNDNPPVFLPYRNNISITEGHMEPGCLVTLEAYDPDIQDRSADQHIVFSVVQKREQHTFLTINNKGCLSLLKPLVRDPSNNYEIWQVLILASDQDGNQETSLHQTTEVDIQVNANVKTN